MTVGRARRPARVIGVGRLLHVIRLVAILVTVTFGWRVSVAYLTPCVHPPADAAARPAEDRCCPDPEGADRPTGLTAIVEAAGEDEDGDCSCPLDCYPGCGGAVLHALPALAPPPLVAVAVLADLPVPELSTHRALADPAGILHVPRAS